jgi:hypothetical protein
MGLDQYAHVVDSNGEKEELAYWRKHPNLQGWMETLYISKGGQEEFNCVPVELDHNDLDNLEQAITNRELPETQGFFFGSDSDEHYKEQDLKFIEKAREALDSGLKVVYDSWW